MENAGESVTRDKRWKHVIGEKRQERLTEEKHGENTLQVESARSKASARKHVRIIAWSKQYNYLRG